MRLYQKTKAYHFTLLLFASIIAGVIYGSFFKTSALYLKPLGDIFLHLMYTLVIPLVFFSIASAIANIEQVQKIRRLMGGMFFVFLITSLIAAVFMLLVLKLFPLHSSLSLPQHINAVTSSQHSNISSILTVSNFGDLLNKDNMLALIIFALLIGFATLGAGEKAKPFQAFLKAGTEVALKAIEYIMYYAPIGFFAYFAVMTAQAGQQLIHNYIEVTVLYYSASLVYFVGAFSLFAFFAVGKKGLSCFWKNSLFPATTALATCSSAASIPANLLAANKMGLPDYLYELSIPLGSIIHKDGSVLGGMLKIAFLFSLFHLSFTGLFTLTSAVVIAMLVGTVMGAIPGGGMIGEMLILSLYGFPTSMLVMVAAISILIDPPATLLNVMGNTISTLLIARVVEGKEWLKKAIKN